MLAFSIFIVGILFLMAMSLSEDDWTGGAQDQEARRAAALTRRSGGTR